jgi:hypothetical protein
MQKPNGLTDREQAIVVLISGLLLALGAITIPSDIPYHVYVGIVVALLGAIGLALKEWAGGAITTSQATLDGMAAGIKALVDYNTAQQQPPSNQRNRSNPRLIRRSLPLKYCR